MYFLEILEWQLCILHVVVVAVVYGGSGDGGGVAGGTFGVVGVAFVVDVGAVDVEHYVNGGNAGYPQVELVELMLSYLYIVVVLPH